MPYIRVSFYMGVGTMASGDVETAFLYLLVGVTVALNFVPASTSKVGECDGS